MQAKNVALVGDVAESALRQTTKEERTGRIVVLAVLLVLLVGVGAVGGYYEGHLSDATPIVAIPWSIR